MKHPQNIAAIAPETSAATFVHLATRRWWIVSLLFFAATLNYVDKNALALLAPTIQGDLGLSNQHYANIQNAFQIAYLLATLASGVIVDKFGPRLSLACFICWWSLAGMFTATARTAMSLGIFRFLLGLGEAGNWAASLKTVSAWFPVKERGLAIGIYTAGTPIGMTLAPLLVIGLAEGFGWRSAFVIMGVAGLVWLIPWFVFFRRNDNSPASETSETAPTTSAVAATSWSWKQLFARPEVWCLLIGRMISDPVWFFYQNWYPKYLVSDRALAQTDVKIVSVMFLAAGLGSLIGGWLPAKFIKPGRLPQQARVLVMLGCGLFMPLSPLVALTPSATISLALASVICFMHLAWLTNITALLVDTVPQASQGKVFSIVAAGSSIGAIAMNHFVAKMLGAGSYNNWFWIASGLHLTVLPLLWLVFYRRHKTSLVSNA